MLNNAEIGSRIRRRLRDHNLFYSEDFLSCCHGGTKWVFSDVNSTNMLIVRRHNDDTFDVLAHDDNVRFVLCIDWLESLVS